MLPAVTVERRQRAHARGIRRWDDPRVCAEALEISSPTTARRLDGVLAVNRRHDAVVLPLVAERTTAALRRRAPNEFFVDVETVSNMGDDLSRLPNMIDASQIVVIGCGYRAGGDPSSWRLGQWIVDELTAEEEARIVAAWLDWLGDACRERGCALDDALLLHWSAAEPVTVEAAYARANGRASERLVPVPPRLAWLDVFADIVRAEPFCVRGAFDFRLKSIRRALADAGVLPADSSEEAGTVLDGLDAMVAAWRAAQDSAQLRLSEHRLLRRVASYNAADVRALRDVSEWFWLHRGHSAELAKG